ncbi:MAG: hypothetical protein K2I70_04975, partial [Bacilli bacterium]|nr:hypothetical protein [Bacilli bacterium]
PYTYLTNILIFVAKIVLFFITKSLAFVISSLYNLGIGLARKKIYSNKDNYKSIGSFVIMASLCFIIYSILTIISHKFVNYNLYIGLAIATITFYDIGYSIYGIVKSIKNNNRQNNLLMLINLATALVSLQLTQSALLSFNNVGVDNSLYNGIIGIIVGIAAAIIGMIICLKS